MVTQDEARRLARSLADEITYTAPPALKVALASGCYSDGDMDEFRNLVWRALECAELAQED